ncbi:exosome complex component RRP4 [Perkinsela sp. CCAP 1560/4]|nr:exosome complex component RRP4 [Perkinsela sp. CCAP 1560/4]|eukprot:KNH06401.1 exosome complex component RRP4 [Perkinsela sp. CCAP 1560/4]
MEFIASENSLVLPGECIATSANACDITLGSGVTFSQSGSKVEISPTIAGVVVTNSTHSQGKTRVKIGIEGRNAYLAPMVGDLVIGHVMKESSGFYFVDINCPVSPAVLDVTSFDGATRYNRPRLQRGSTIFAHVIHSGRGNEPEISCCATSGTARRDWVTGEGDFGQLNGGLVINVPPFLARMLLEKRISIIDRIASYASFDLAIGLNGRIWIKASSAQVSSGIAYILEGCALHGPAHMEQEVPRVFSKDSLSE